MIEGEIRMLTLWQSWASLIPAGVKRFETRSWGTKYRGWLAIHAAKKPSFLVQIPRGLLTNEQIQAVQIMYPLPHGGIVAICKLLDCLEMWDSGVFGPLMPPSRRGVDIAYISTLEKAVGDWKEGRFAWVLESVQPLKPIWCNGGQGLRRVSSELREEIGRSLEGCLNG